MSLHIKQIVLHQLVKRDEKNIDIVLRDAVLEDNTDVQMMMTQLHRVYNTKNKAFGLFSDSSVFAQSVKKYLSGQEDFIAFTQVSTRQLCQELTKYPFAEGGIVVFCHYTFLATEYLLVTVLNSCDSTLVNDNLDVITTHYLDIVHADIVACLDITEWQVSPDSNRYLTFLKGRVGRKIADFFMDYLGAEGGLDTKAQNKQLLQAVDDYCHDAALDKTTKMACRQEVYSYCKEQIQAGEELELQALSQTLPNDDNKNFQQFVSENAYSLEPHFPADKSTLRQLTKFSGSGGGVTLSFDHQLLGERVIWDPRSDTLTIKGLPPNLRDQLKRSSQDS